MTNKAAPSFSQGTRREALLAGMATGADAGSGWLFRKGCKGDAAELRFRKESGEEGTAWSRRSSGRPFLR